MYLKQRLRVGIETICVFICGLLLVGCKPEVLPNSGNHPPLKPSEVKLYQDQPKKYEEMGRISIPVTAEIRWDDRGDSTSGFAMFKAKAAAMGANGVLFRRKSGSEEGSWVTAGDNGTFYTVPITPNPPTAFGEAIFVLKE